MAKRNYSGAGSKSILSNDSSKFANLPTDVMMKDAGYISGGLSNSIGDEFANIERQVEGDNAKARQDYKLRKA